jgi:hypothetical protein
VNGFKHSLQTSTLFSLWLRRCLSYSTLETPSPQTSQTTGLKIKLEKFNSNQETIFLTVNLHGACELRLHHFCGAFLFFSRNSRISSLVDQNLKKIQVNVVVYV